MNDVNIDIQRGEIAAYNQFRAELRQLAELNAKTVFDYEDPQGNKDARSHIYKLRLTKGAVEKTRKEEKQASLDYGRKVDAEAKEIIGEIEAMIEVHEAPIKAIEQREKDRIAQHETALMEIEGSGDMAAEQWLETPLDAMKSRLAEIEAEPITEDRWEEFVALAAQKKDRAVQQLREAIGKREKHDAEQAELERLRKEAAEREQRERDERIAREAEERARREAEEAAHRERERVEREKREAEERAENERKARIEAEERAEREKQAAAEQAKRDAEAAVQREREAQVARERQEREDAERREANKRHRAKINNAAKDAFVTGGLDEEAAKRAVELIALREIPAVTISY